MAADIPEIEPLTVRAGDTVKWTKDLSDYPASTWTLKYIFRGPSDFNITATGSGSTHSVTVARAVTELWPKGLYNWIAVVTSSTERFQVGSGSMTVEINLETDTHTYDTRSPAKQILDALDATILRAAARPESSYQLAAGGTQMAFRSFADLIVARDKFAAIVQSEEEAAKIARGENTGKNILARFL